MLQWRVNGVTAEEVVASLLGTLKPEEYGYDIQVMCKLLDACVYQCELAVGEYDLSMLYMPSEVGLAAVLNGLGTLVDGGLMEMKGRYEYVIRLVELLNGEAGGEEDQIVVAVSEFLDAALPLDILIPGAPGIAAEALDGKLFGLLVPLFLKAFRVDPEKRAARKAKRAARKASRQA